MGGQLGFDMVVDAAAPVPALPRRARKSAAHIKQLRFELWETFALLPQSQADLAAQQRLARDYEGLVIKLATQFKGQLDLNDALSAGFEGLRLACSRYHARPSREFTNLVYRTVLNKITDAIRAKNGREKRELLVDVSERRQCAKTRDDFERIDLLESFAVFWEELTEQEQEIVIGIQKGLTPVVIGAALGLTQTELMEAGREIGLLADAHGLTTADIRDSLMLVENLRHMAKIRVQVGIQAGSSVRLTPYDQTHEAGGAIADLLLVFASMIDATDVQPGDGEIDIPLGKATDALKSKLGFLKGLDLPGEEVVFVRLRRVA